MNDTELREIEWHLALCEAIASGQAVCHDRKDRVAVSVSVRTTVYNVRDLEEEAGKVKAWIPRVEEHLHTKIDLRNSWHRMLDKEAELYMVDEKEQAQLFEAECQHAQNLLDRLKASEKALQCYLLKHQTE